MNEIQALKIKVANSKNIYDIIECCKDWREILFKKIKTDDGSKLKLRKYQLPLSNKIVDCVISAGALGNELTSLWSRQSGKTETVADTVLVLGTFYLIFLNRGFNAGLFAPVESMITHVTRNRLRKRFKGIKNWLYNKASIRQVAGEGVTSSLFILENIITKKEFSCRSLSVGEQAQIIGETFQLLIIEQSELINAMKLKNDVFPMGAETGGVRVMTGTTSPYFKNEYFKAAVQKWSDDPTKNRSTSDWIEIIDYKEASKVSVSYRRYVARERDRWGKDSIEFKTQFGLEWVGATLKFIGWEKLVSLEKDYKWDKERLRFFGIDVARAGDSTIVTIIEINGTEIHIIAWLELEGLEFEDQIKKIIPFLKRYAPLRFGLVDKPGLGVALFDMLKRRLWDEVEDERGIIKKVAWARVDGYYGSVKENDEMYKNMDREFQHDRVFFPKHTKYKREKARFIDQILDLERKYSGHSLKLVAPKIKGRHDDYPISTALAIYAFKEKSHKTGVTYVDF